MNDSRYLNLVFQGGGVRGIAYAGVLQSKPSNIAIHAVGGTSAGAIVAALLAIGKSGTELQNYLDPAKFCGFLKEDEKQCHRKLISVIDDIRALWAAAIKNKRKIRWWEAINVFRKHRSTITETLSEVMQREGLYQSIGLRNWLDEIFEGKTFRDIVVDDLRIVAADTNRRSYYVYNKANSISRPIAEAVHASVSIPLFFVPFQIGNQRLVDGGILSNFPSYLFAKEKYPTIGFRLRDIAPPAQVESFLDYLVALLLTMAEAHDNNRGDPPHFKAYEIPIPAVRATEFSLNPTQAKALLEQGVKVGNTVDWRAFSSSIPLVSYYDPKPFEALEQSVSEAHKLFESHVESGFRPEILEEEVDSTVTIEADWTTRYQMMQRLKVSGGRPLFISRLRLTGVAEATRSQSGVSITDIDYKCEELKHCQWNPLIKIPALNSEKEKGFVVFFVPPVSAGQDWRDFRTTWSFPKEFQSTLGKGSPDKFYYASIARADKHALSVRLRVLVDTELPDLSVESTSAFKMKEGTLVRVEATNRTYRVFEGGSDSVNITGCLHYEVLIARKS